jgi:diacylglycerol kinase (ATP)
VNPVARRTAGAEPSVLRAFRAAGVALTVEHTRAAGDGVRLARELAATHDRLFVLGGDGTVTEVATGLAEARSAAAIGILPSGTGNQLARALSVPLNPSRAVGALLAGEVRHLDLAILNGHRRVGIGAGAGLDAAMIAGARGRLKQILGVSSYVVSVARAALRPRRFTVRAEVDGRVIEREGAVAMVLNLGRIFNGTLELAPGASLTDGVLDLVIVDAHGLGDAVAFSVVEMLLRRRRADPRWTFARGREISVEVNDASIPCQVDGDLVDDRRLSLVVAPGERGLLAPLGAHII